MEESPGGFAVGWVVGCAVGFDFCVFGPADAEVGVPDSDASWGSGGVGDVDFELFVLY